MDNIKSNTVDTDNSVSNNISFLLFLLTSSASSKELVLI